MSKIHKIDNNPDTVKYEDFDWIVLDGWGTIAGFLNKWIIPPWLLLNRDVRRYLMVNSIGLDKIKSEPLIVEWVEFKVPKLVIEQTEAQLRSAFLFPDIYSKVTYNRVEYDDVIECFKAHGKKIFIWTNSWEPYVEALERLLQNGKIDGMFASCRMWTQKPDRKFFEQIKEETGINRLVVVWDDINSDIKWANDVWIPAVYMDRNHKGPPEIMYIKRLWIYVIKVWTAIQLLDVLLKH